MRFVIKNIGLRAEPALGDMSMKMMMLISLALLVVTGCTTIKTAGIDRQWSESEAKEWYEQEPWLVGCNFLPSTACNQFEMWQAETFDPVTIERELGWASDREQRTAPLFGASSRTSTDESYSGEF